MVVEPMAASRKHDLLVLSVVAKKIVTDAVDDLDGTSGAETNTFALNGVVYDIDLTPKNAAELAAALAPFLEKARRINSVRLMRVTKLDRSGKRQTS